MKDSCCALFIFSIILPACVEIPKDPDSIEFPQGQWMTDDDSEFEGSTGDESGLADGDEDDDADWSEDGMGDSPSFWHLALESEGVDLELSGAPEPRSAQGQGQGQPGPTLDDSWEFGNPTGPTTPPGGGGGSNTEVIAEPPGDPQE